MQPDRSPGIDPYGEQLTALQVRNADLERQLRECQIELQRMKTIEHQSGDRLNAEIRFQAALLDQVRNAVICTDLEDRITYWNKFAETLYQWSAEEVIGRTMAEVLVPLSRQYAAAVAFAKLREHHYREGEYVLQRKDGSTLIVLSASSAIWDDQGELVGFVDISTDVSDRKQAELALARSEAQYRLLFENNPSPMWVFDPVSLAFLAVNDAAIEKYGYSEQEFLSMTVADIRPPEDISELIQDLSAEDPLIYSAEWRHQKRNGDIFDVEIVSHPIYWEGQYAKFVLAQDVSDRKRAEAALMQSEKQYRLLFEKNPNPMWIYDIETYQFLAVNQVAIDHYGYSEAEFLAMTIEDIRPEADIPRLREFLGHSAMSPYRGEWDHRKRDGTVFSVEVTYSEIVWEGKSARVVLIKDISEQKAALRERQQAEEALYRLNQELELRVQTRTCDLMQSQLALRQSEELFRRLFDDAPIGIVLVKVSDHCFFRANQQFCKMLGYTAEEVSTLTFTDITYYEDLPLEFSLAHQVLSGVIPGYELEKRYIKKNGEIFWVHLTATLIRDADGKPQYGLGMVNDITERKKVESALRQSERRYSTLAEALPVAVFYTDTQGQNLYSNQRWCDMTGLTVEESRGTGWTAALHPDDRERLVAEWDASVRQNVPFQTEHRILCRNGKTAWVYGQAVAETDSTGRILGYIGTLTDISERKLVEEERKQTEITLHQLVEREQLLRAITQRIRQSLNLDEILSAAVSEVRKTLNADRALIFQLTPTGSGRVIKESVESGLPVLAEGEWEDACLSLDSSQYYGLGQPRIVPNIAEDAWANCLVDMLQQIGVQSKVCAPIVQTLENGSTRVWGLLVVHACSNRRQWQPEEAEFLQQISNQLAIAIQQASLYQRMQSELTERKQVEEQLRSSLKEKEVLLKEVHHRVKNNLQMISSLLNLQASSIQDPETLKPFTESQRRVKTMALIHEKLYQSENLAKIKFSEYVKELTNDLFRSYITTSDIHLNVEVPQVELAVDVAIPCGLIINELVSNAIKYAFSNGRSGEVKICFSVQPCGPESLSNQYILSVHDNGTGFPEDLDVCNTESLGLQLVCALTHKLRGTINVDRSNGSTFIITFTHL